MATELKANAKRRAVPLRVISAGMSRTGTGTMRKALEALGIGPAFHGFTLGWDSQDMATWIDLTDRKYPRSGDAVDARPITAEHFDLVLGNYAAVTDMPCVAFWRELMAAYPDAKVVLVRRDIDTWERSFNQVFVDCMLSGYGQIIATPWVARLLGYRTLEMLHRLCFCYFQARNKHEVQANARTIYQEHNENVRRACREQDRPLLEYKLGSGWEPLCRFLDVDVPDGLEFPRENRVDVLTKVMMRAQRKMMLQLALMSSAALAAVITAARIALYHPNSSRSWIMNLWRPW